MQMKMQPEKANGKDIRGVVAFRGAAQRKPYIQGARRTDSPIELRRLSFCPHVPGITSEKTD